MIPAFQKPQPFFFKTNIRFSHHLLVTFILQIQKKGFPSNTSKIDLLFTHISSSQKHDFT